MRIATLRKPGSGGRRDGAGRKPGSRKLPRLQRIAIGSWCEREWVAEADAKFNEARLRARKKPVEDRRIFEDEWIGRRPWGARVKIIEAAAARFGITASYVTTCWREYRKVEPRLRLLGREPGAAMSAADERALRVAFGADGRIRKLQALAARPGTPAEGAAAQAAIDRVTRRPRQGRKTA
jgi:hypothetical protein